MALFQRREERAPHPDGRVEAALQIILTYRRMTEAKERQIGRDRRQIRRLDRGARRRRGYGQSSKAFAAEHLRREVREAEREILELQSAIADQVNELNPDDLLWL